MQLTTAEDITSALALTQSVTKTSPMRIRNLYAPLISKTSRVNCQRLHCWTGLTRMPNGRPCMSVGIGIQLVSDTAPFALTVSEPSGLTATMSATSLPPSWSTVFASSQITGTVAVSHSEFTLHCTPKAFFTYVIQ